MVMDDWRRTAGALPLRRVTNRMGASGLVQWVQNQTECPKYNFFYFLSAGKNNPQTSKFFFTASSLSANISDRLGHGRDDDYTLVDTPHKKLMCLLFSAGHTWTVSHTLMSRILKGHLFQPLPISRLVISKTMAKESTFNEHHLLSIKYAAKYSSLACFSVFETGA